MIGCTFKIESMITISHSFELHLINIQFEQEIWIFSILQISNLNDSGHHDDGDTTSLDGGRKSPKKFDAESPDPTFVSVVTIPDPGESCTDEDVVEKPVTANVVVTGSYLGGVANIGFEAEEEHDSGRGRESPINDSFDAGYKRNRNLSDVNIRFWSNSIILYYYISL